MSVVALSPKQPGETVQGLFIDFRKRFLTGETVTSATVTSSVDGMVSPGSVEWSGSVVSWAATGGVNGDNAVFTVVATGSLGSIREGEVSMKVKEIP